MKNFSLLLVKKAGSAFISDPKMSDKSIEEILFGCSKLYCQIWREPPWSEDFWVPEDVLKDLKSELERDFGSLFIARDPNQEIVGFTWGYLVDCLKIRSIAGHNKLDSLFCPETRIFYVDELGVDSNFRRLGVGESLSQNLIAYAAKERIDKLLLRTDKEAHPAKKLYEKIGFRELEINDSLYPTRTYWIKIL